MNTAVKFGTRGVIEVRRSVKLVASTETTFVMVTIVGMHDANIVEKSMMLDATFVKIGVMHGAITEIAHSAEQSVATTPTEMDVEFIVNTADTIM